MLQPPVSWSLVLLVPVRGTVAPMRRRRREGALLSRQLTRDRFSSRVDGHSGGRARAATAARGTGETGRARSHGGFVDSRAVRRRKRVLWRPRKARGSRGGQATRVMPRTSFVLRQLRAREGDVFKVSSLERLYASPAVCSRREFEDAGPHVLVYVVLALTAYFGFTIVPYPNWRKCLPPHRTGR